MATSACSSASEGIISADLLWGCSSRCLSARCASRDVPSPFSFEEEFESSCQAQVLEFHLQALTLNCWSVRDLWLPGEQFLQFWGVVPALSSGHHPRLVSALVLRSFAVQSCWRADCVNSPCLFFQAEKWESKLLRSLLNCYPCVQPARMFTWVVRSRAKARLLLEHHVFLNTKEWKW